ncbi:MAG TPA: TonB-dependent receptor [Mucilaginibacter sp.]|jgi:TonB-linked SusC/RagA family outer membrane protein|nr:TonB-dependent receptor [Mucilaginibacter sp.]
MGKNLRFLSICLIAAVACFFPRLSQAQTHTLRGFVRDTAGRPLPGVSIKVRGDNLGTVTGNDGGFNLLLHKPESILDVSLVGFEKRSVAVKTETTISIILKEIKSELKEVVVVGYGTQKKSDITGAISSIKNKDFRDQPVSNLAVSIEGKLSGINVTQPSGTPGAGLLVSIRGAKNPLYVVDGVPMLSESNSSLNTSYDLTGAPVGDGQNISSISDINPDDIESIEILKDASTAAIYGSRAANGVILITTKHGKSGKTSVNFNYYTGVQTIEKNIQFLNSRQFYNLTNEAIADDIKIYDEESKAAGKDTSRYGPLSVLQSVGIVDGNGNPVKNPVAPYYDLSSGINTNWLDQIFRTAPVSSYELSASGGTEKTKFYVGGSYFDQDGIVINNYYHRYNVRSNIENQATDHLSFGADISASYSDNKRSFNDNTYTGVITNAIGASPLMPVYSSPGVYADFTQYQASWLSDNPVKSAQQINAHTYTDRFIGSVYGEYKITPELKFRSTWSLDFDDVNDSQYFSALTVDAQTVDGKLLIGNNTSLTWLNENIFTYDKKFGKSTLTAIGGFTQQQIKRQMSALQGTGFPQTGDVQDISAAAFVSKPIILYPLVYSVLQSGIGRVNYAYDNRYLLTATVRADGSSRFPVDNRWGYFPSASAGWNIGNEQFLSGSAIVDELKLRVSYGVTGDQEIPDYQNQVYWGPAKYNGNPGLTLSNLSAPALSWQQNSTFNTGADFDLFNHFINGSIEYFISERSRLLGQQPVAGTTGFAYITTNSGKIEDKGWEFQVNTNNIRQTDFSWTSAFNISFLKNTIKALAVDNQLLSSYTDQPPTNVLKVGQAVGTFIGVPFAGVNPANGDAEYYAADGSLERADQVNFSRDERIIGSPRPKFFGGFTNTFRIKQFDIVVATQFSYGNKVYNLIKTTYESLGWSGASTPASAYLPQVYANNDVAVLNAWSHPGQITNIPRPSFLLQNYYPNSSEFLEDGSFLKVRTLSVGYTLPKSKYYSSIRLYAQVENLLTITKYTGFDPEVSSNGGADDETQGVDFAAYPQARTFTIGASIKF